MWDVKYQVKVANQANMYTKALREYSLEQALRVSCPVSCKNTITTNDAKNVVIIVLWIMKHSMGGAKGVVYPPCHIFVGICSVVTPPKLRGIIENHTQKFLKAEAYSKLRHASKLIHVGLIFAEINCLLNPNV